MAASSSGSNRGESKLKLATDDADGGVITGEAAAAASVDDREGRAEDNDGVEVEEVIELEVGNEDADVIAFGGKGTLKNKNN